MTMAYVFFGCIAAIVLVLPFWWTYKYISYVRVRRQWFIDHENRGVNSVRPITPTEVHVMHNQPLLPNALDTIVEIINLRLALCADGNMHVITEDFLLRASGFWSLPEFVDYYTDAGWHITPEYDLNDTIRERPTSWTFAAGPRS